MATSSLPFRAFLRGGGNYNFRHYGTSWGQPLREKELWATEELSATITVVATFSFRGLTKKEISVIMGLRRKVWG